MRALALGAYLQVATASAYYVWPSPQLDALESLRWDQAGHNRRVFVAFVQPCSTFFFQPPGSGRSDLADWVRTAYHDMATHNVEDGTGGMDASIRFTAERARGENPGDGFANTISALASLGNRYVSIADALAVGTVVAMESCGGPEIAFRGGRVDAMEPNDPGVPEPDQSLESHIASFARQGFTPSEMIGLVACGHSFGGVEHAPFPGIVPEMNDPTNTNSVAHFDSTNVKFDNNVATEYISGTTQNPLVIGLNDTTNSDKRIFASDGNATMQAFANSAELFASTCADLFARMLDTVPRGVQLTEVIKPLPVKPSGLDLVLDGDVLKLSGEVRFWNMTASPDRAVRLLWDDRVGGTNNVSLLTSGVSTAINGRYSAAWYQLGSTENPTPSLSIESPFVPIDPAAGITNMRFVVDNKLEDQGGIGFAVQDGVVFSNSSCLTSKNPLQGRLDVAVRNGLNPSRVYLVQEVAQLTPEPQRPEVVETDIPRPSGSTVNPDAPYFIWSVDFDTQGATYTIEAIVDGVKIVWDDKRAVSDFPLCAS
ncbi:putative L-ascorbate oxidase [Mycena rebaudengoi]|nr:putative L-ascorbate oxidase [Mycena rebaudengoi]